MAVYTARDICINCTKTLPRAALNRCPFCLEPIQRVTSIGEIICRRCKSSIPRAHAGQCPSCAVAYRGKARAVSGRGRLQ